MCRVDPGAGRTAGDVAAAATTERSADAAAGGVRSRAGKRQRGGEREGVRRSARLRGETTRLAEEKRKRGEDVERGGEGRAAKRILRSSEVRP